MVAKNSAPKGARRPSAKATKAAMASLPPELNAAACALIDQIEAAHPGPEADEVPPRDINADVVEATAEAEVQPEAAPTTPGLARLRAAPEAEAIRAAVLSDQAEGRAAALAKIEAEKAAAEGPAPIAVPPATPDEDEAELARVNAMVEAARAAEAAALAPVEPIAAPAEIPGAFVAEMPAVRRGGNPALSAIAEAHASEGAEVKEKAKAARKAVAKASRGPKAAPAAGTRRRAIWDFLTRPEGATAHEMREAGWPDVSILVHAKRFADSHGLVLKHEKDGARDRCWLIDPAAEGAPAQVEAPAPIADPAAALAAAEAQAIADIAEAEAAVAEAIAALDAAAAPTETSIAA